MSAAAAVALSLLWPGVANAQLSCANGQPPVTGLSGVPSCPDPNTTAEMVDGSIYRQTPEIYATEGPIYEIDVANQEVHVMGKVLKIPVVVNYGGFTGTTMNISGSGIRGNDSEARSEMDALNIDRMLDTNAVFRDAAGGANGNADQTGAVRSVFSGDVSFAKDPTADAQINANYKMIVEACYSRHAAFLPANFLELALGVDGLREPPYYGGTFKTAGHRYVLESCPSGNCRPDVLVPDIEVVLELAENVTEGTVTSAFAEDLNLGCPPSLTIDDQMLVMNPDPRFGRDILGIVGQEINPALFTNLDGTIIAAIGHMRGEHVNFMQEILTDLIDPNDVVHITLDKGQITETNTVDGTFGGDILSVRAIGAIDKPQAIEGFTGVDLINGSAGLAATLGAVDALGNYVNLSIVPRPLAVVQGVEGREGTFTLRGRQDMEVFSGQGILVSHMQVCGLVSTSSGTPDAGTVVCSEPHELENSAAPAFEVLADEAGLAAAPAPVISDAQIAANAAAAAANLAAAEAAALAAAATASAANADAVATADAAAASAAADQAAVDAAAAAAAAQLAADAQAASDAAAAIAAADFAAANPIVANNAGAFDISLVPGGDPLVPNANFVGLFTDVQNLPTAGTNASRLIRPRFDFVITDVPRNLFTGTGDSFGDTGTGLGEAIDLIGVATPSGQIGVGDEIGVDRFSLTFTDVNGAIIRVFGGDNVQIVAQQTTAGDGVTVTGARQDVTWVLFSIRDQGLAVDVTTPPLVVGSSLATMRVDSDIIATWSLVGDSSTPEGALAVSITAGGNNATPAAAAAAAADVVAANAAAAADAAAAAAAANEAAFNRTATADGRGRLRDRFPVPVGCNVVANTPGITCRSRAGRDSLCRGRIQSNQEVTFSCQ